MTMTSNDRDRFVIVAGAVFMALTSAMDEGYAVDVIADEVGPTTSLWLRLPFMKSRYRVTVTMDPEVAGAQQSGPASEG